MRRSASEIIRNLQQRVARLEKSANKISQTRWRRDPNEISSMHETYLKEFKDSQGRVTSYMNIKLYKKNRTPRGYGWSLEFTDFGQTTRQGNSLHLFPDGSIYQTTDLYWHRDDKDFYETKEEALAASKRFITWLKKNKPTAFIYYREDYSGHDWVHDGYV